MSSCNLQQQSQVSNYSFMAQGPRVYEQLSLNSPNSYLTNTTHHHHSHAAAAAAAAAVAAQQHHNNQRAAANCQINGYGNILPTNQPAQPQQQQQQNNLNTSTSGMYQYFV